MSHAKRENVKIVLWKEIITLIRKKECRNTYLSLKCSFLKLVTISHNFCQISTNLKI
jgi:hypothetical protein